MPSNAADTVYCMGLLRVVDPSAGRVPGLGLNAKVMLSGIWSGTPLPLNAPIPFTCQVASIAHPDSDTVTPGIARRRLMESVETNECRPSGPRSSRSMLNDGISTRVQFVVLVPRPASSSNVWVVVCGSGSLRSIERRLNSFSPVWGRLWTTARSTSRSEGMTGKVGAFVKSRIVEASSIHGSTAPHDDTGGCQPQPRVTEKG